MRPSQSGQRLDALDQLRGIAVLLMVFYHFVYDLTLFGYASFNMNDVDGWRFFRGIILTLFIGVAGMSIFLAHQHKFDWRKFSVRSLKLAACALVVTIMSLFLFPNAWIYFGILHFLLFASLVSVVFIRIPIVALVTGFVCIWVGYMDWLHFYWPFQYVREYLPSGKTQDFVSVFPWVGVSLSGVFVAYFLRRPLAYFNNKAQPLILLGRHSLLIYMLHQPFLYGSVWLFSKIFG